MTWAVELWPEWIMLTVAVGMWVCLWWNGIGRR